MTVLERLSELGITLPAVAAPVAAYVPAIKTRCGPRVSSHLWMANYRPSASLGRISPSNKGPTMPAKPHSTHWPPSTHLLALIMSNGC